MKVLGLLVCCTLAFAKNSQNPENPVVQTATGIYQGTKIPSHSGKDIYSFTAIRYAEAPTGINRFKEASPVKPHDGIFNATKKGPVCALPYGEQEEISEDCLRLNVYTTTLSPQADKPVVVFLHPGEYSQSFGSSYGLGPQFALDQDLVLVTLNYRLGALGFLSTGDERAPGNAGLKDQVLALKWVQQNVAAFGGDPNSVLLAGQDIGAASVTLHIVSPLSSGLFQRGLIISGAASTENSLPGDRKDLAKKQAELLGCPSDMSDSMFTCLGGKSVHEFANTYQDLATYNGHQAVWMPVVEQASSSTGGKPFLTSQLSSIISQGQANYVPIIVGINTDESIYAATQPEIQAQDGNNQLYDKLNENWQEIAPKLFDYERDTPKSSQISQALKSYYFNDQPLKAGSYRALGNLYSDAWVNMPVHRFERLMATYSPEPVYYYKYAFENSDTYKTWSNGTRFGVVHFDELFILFKIAGRPAIDQKGWTRSQELWEWNSDFAKYGKPVPPHKAEKYNFAWEPSTKSQPQYLEYKGKENRMVQGIIYQQRMNKWDELFPLE